MRRIFTALLRLYPERIRREFTAEMLDVFEQASAKVRQSGTPAYCAFVMRELCGLIVDLVIEGAHVTHKRGIVYGALAGLLISGAFSWGWMSRPYTSIALLRVQPSQLPDRLVPAQLHSDLPRETMSATQSITSRSSLMNLIDTERLYASDLSRKPVQVVIEDMRQAIQIALANQNEIRMSFTYSDREAAQRVAGRLVAALINRCVVFKTQQTKLAVEFLRDTRDKAGKDWEQAVAKFRANQKSGGGTDRAALDAEIAKQRYIDLSTKLAEAETIASLQERQQGETLELIDPASLPSERKLPWAALAGATATGGVVGWVVAHGLEGRRRIRLALAQA